MCVSCSMVIGAAESSAPRAISDLRGGVLGR